MAFTADHEYHKRNYQVENFDVSRRPGSKTILDALANPSEAAVEAADKTFIDRREDELTKFANGEEQYKGVFVSDDAGQLPNNT